eukprot:2108324-Rhodomonas_salina.1
MMWYRDCSESRFTSMTSRFKFDSGLRVRLGVRRSARTKVDSARARHGHAGGCHGSYSSECPVARSVQSIAWHCTAHASALAGDVPNLASPGPRIR